MNSIGLPGFFAGAKKVMPASLFHINIPMPLPIKYELIDYLTICFCERQLEMGGKQCKVTCRAHVQLGQAPLLLIGNSLKVKASINMRTVETRTSDREPPALIPGCFAIRECCLYSMS